jgi:hypothetical protein
VKKLKLALPIVGVLFAYWFFKDRNLTDGQHKQWQIIEQLPEICTMFERDGYDLRKFIVCGKKLTMAQVDTVLGKYIPWATSKMFIKNLLLQARLMPFGVVGRTAADIEAAKDFVTEIDNLK